LGPHLNLARAGNISHNIAVKLWSRLAIAAFGLYLSGYGVYLMCQKVFDYQDRTYRAVMFAPAVVATGIFVAALALVPTRIVERVFRSEKRRPDIHPHYHRHHDDSPPQT
jgi:peptidoglycan/LPS O-acetylase OafA/YrhL